jgi:hypothetical protein
VGRQRQGVGQREEPAFFEIVTNRALANAAAWQLFAFCGIHDA